MKYTATDRKICIALDGRIDTNNAAQTEKEIFDILGQHEGKDIVFDADTPYASPYQH